MTTKHTAGPWHVHTDGVVTCADGLSPDSRKRPTAERLANRRRYVQCLNRCEGLNPEAVPDLLAACEEAEAVLCDYQLWHDDGTRCEDLEVAIQDTLCAAVAKAKGTSK